MRPIYMSYLTAPVADPMEALMIASDAGYDGLGLRLHDPLVTDPGLRAAFRARMGELGLCVTEIEAWMLRRDPTDPRVFETAAELGARRLVSVADLPRGRHGRRVVRSLCRPVPGGGGAWVERGVRTDRLSRGWHARGGDAGGGGREGLGCRSGSGRLARASYGHDATAIGAGRSGAAGGVPHLRCAGRCGRPAGHDRPFGVQPNVVGRRRIAACRLSAGAAAGVPDFPVNSNGAVVRGFLPGRAGPSVPGTDESSAAASGRLIRSVGAIKRRSVSRKSPLGRTNGGTVVLRKGDSRRCPRRDRTRVSLRRWMSGKFWCVRLTDASAAGVSPAERKGSHHFHREPCAGHREVSGEASVAACTGRAIEPRKS